MKKRMFCLMLALLMLLGCVAAAEDANERTLVLAGFDDTQYRKWEDNLFFQRMEEKTGVKFTYQQYTKEEEWTKAKVAMEKGGEMPDVLFKAALTTTECIEMYEKGVLVVERAPGSDEDEMMMLALDAGAEDMKAEEDVYEIYTAPADFSAVREALENQGLSFLSAEVNKIPQNTVAVTDPDTLKNITKMLEMLEENDDVQNVWHNAELPEEPEED